jgi:DNA-binding response OmpR family regulator
VLAALLEHPGEIVSREQLISRLWAGGTNVDFDRGLNAAVTRLRQALSDSAETPKYMRQSRAAVTALSARCRPGASRRSMHPPNR